MPQTTPLTVFEASVKLYAASEDGSILAEVWAGECVERVHLTGQFQVTETLPTGRRFPRRHPLIQRHEIRLERFWVVRYTDMAGFVPLISPHVLDILWTDEETGYWKRRVYFGVTIKGDDFESQDANSTAGQFIETQSFDAEFYQETSGSGEPPAQTMSIMYGEHSPYVFGAGYQGVAAQPMHVQYVNSQGVLELYNYTSGVFTETVAGVSAGRATLGYVGGVGGTFECRFNGYSTTRFRCEAQEVFVAGGYRTLVPSPADIPRLDFLIGQQRAASITHDGFLYCPAILVTTPAAGGMQFEFQSSSVLTAVFRASDVTLRAAKIG